MQKAGFHKEAGDEPGLAVATAWLDQAPKLQAGLGEGTQLPYDPGHVT